jgi:hypothetical protein
LRGTMRDVHVPHPNGPRPIGYNEGVDSRRANSHARGPAALAMLKEFEKVYLGGNAVALEYEGNE